MVILQGVKKLKCNYGKVSLRIMVESYNQLFKIIDHNESFDIKQLVS